ncbi:serine hydrolase domain-containing protein [Specibacter sp. AOP5-B1-6]|uniref:serine hydrolase domain-containing protein n=1 Tax=Specibacter sp. AOP5-B1-6 TaxID=3457653 RepID=UPI003FB6D0E2
MSAQFEPVWRALEEKVASGWAPGLVAGIRHRGTTEIFATGVRTLGLDAPMRDDTPFRVSSLGKLVAGALSVSMIADGSLSPDDPADVWLPELAYPRVLTSPDAALTSTVPAEHDITVRQLLTLTHGMGLTFDDTPLARAMDAAGLLPGTRPLPMTADEYMARIGALPLAHQPGTRWSYHVGSDILSVLLARAGQAPLRQILRERITGPLGMDATGFAGDPRELPTAYKPTTAGLAVFDEPDGQFSQPPPFESFGGGLVSSVPDYLAFLAALADDTLLPAELRAEMTKDQLTTGQKAGLAGMMEPGASWGWQVSVETGDPEPVDPEAADRPPGAREPWNAPGRYGWSGGSGTTAYVDPSRDLIAVLFTQRLLAGPDEDFSYFWKPLAAALKGGPHPGGAKD